MVLVLSYLARVLYFIRRFIENSVSLSHLPAFMGILYTRSFESRAITNSKIK